jgi:hypothetical protein
MSNITETDKQLVPFLRDLADSIESNQLLPDQLLQIAEFFISYKFSHETQIQDTDEDDPMDIVKFMTMGWYIYKVLSETEEQKTEEQKTEEQKTEEHNQEVSPVVNDID